MIVLGILVSIAAIGTMCWLLFNLAVFALKVDVRRFKEVYRKTPGKCWVPGMEWAEVIEKVLSTEGVMR